MFGPQPVWHPSALPYDDTAKPKLPRQVVPRYAIIRSRRAMLLLVVPRYAIIRSCRAISPAAAFGAGLRISRKSGERRGVRAPREAQKPPRRKRFFALGFRCAPCGLVNSPSGPVNSPRGLANSPRGLVNSPRGLVNSPRGMVNSPRGLVNSPRGEVWVSGARQFGFTHLQPAVLGEALAEAELGEAVKENAVHRPHENGALTMPPNRKHTRRAAQFRTPRRRRSDLTHT
eukprot:1189397-Prorocentrum_minimum.AAC.1